MIHYFWTFIIIRNRCTARKWYTSRLEIDYLKQYEIHLVNFMNDLDIEILSQCYTLRIDVDYCTEPPVNLMNFMTELILRSSTSSSLIAEISNASWETIRISNLNYYSCKFKTRLNLQIWLYLFLLVSCKIRGHLIQNMHVLFDETKIISIMKKERTLQVIHLRSFPALELHYLVFKSSE